MMLILKRFHRLLLQHHQKNFKISLKPVGGERGAAGVGVSKLCRRRFKTLPFRFKTLSSSFILTKFWNGCPFQNFVFLAFQNLVVFVSKHWKFGFDKVLKWLVMQFVCFVISIKVVPPICILYSFYIYKMLLQFLHILHLLCENVRVWHGLSRGQIEMVFSGCDMVWHGW